MNILVITTRNIYGNSGEYSLMSAKDKALKSKGVNLLYYSFRRKFTDSTPEDLNIIAKESTLNIVLKKKKILQSIKNIIVENDVKIIVLSGGWIFLLHKEFSKLQEELHVKFSFDYQGAIEEIVEYNITKNKFLSLLLYKILRYYENIVINKVDGIEVVSQNCIYHIEKVYNISKEQKRVIIHCGIVTPISLDEYNHHRQVWRDKYNIDDNDRTYVYIGGVAPWQNIDEIIAFAKNKNIKLYIFTSPHNQELLKKSNEISKNIYFGFLPHEQLQYALCAFDYGFLLRNEDITNYVAFPNKYSDYINARLRVVLKSEAIGCFPLDKRWQGVIAQDENSLINEAIYSEYIDYLSYEKMIEKLVVYYNEL